MLIVKSCCVFLVKQCAFEKAGALVWSLPGCATFSTAAQGDRAESVPPNYLRTSPAYSGSVLCKSQEEEQRIDQRTVTFAQDMPGSWRLASPFRVVSGAVNFFQLCEVNSVALWLQGAEDVTPGTRRHRGVRGVKNKFFFVSLPTADIFIYLFFCHSVTRAAQ